MKKSQNLVWQSTETLPVNSYDVPLNMTAILGPPHHSSLLFIILAPDASMIYWCILPNGSVKTNHGHHTLSLYTESVGIHVHEAEKATVQGTLKINMMNNDDDDDAASRGSFYSQADEGMNISNKNSWIEVDRSKFKNTNLFTSGDGFDVYIDAARFLPENLAISKTTVVALHSDMSVHEKEDNAATALLGSNVQSPVYDLVR